MRITTISSLSLVLLLLLSLSCSDSSINYDPTFTMDHIKSEKKVPLNHQECSNYEAEQDDLMIQNQVTHAVLISQNRVTNFPDNSYAHYLLGRAFAITGDLKHASESYMRSTKLGPPIVNGYLGLGNIEYTKNNLRAASTYYKEALKINPRSLLAQARIAGIYFAENNQSEVVATLQKMLVIDPDSEYCHFLIALTRLQKNDFLGSIEGFKLSMEKKPTFFEAIYGRAYAYFSLGAFGLALEDLNRADMLQRRNLGVRFLRAQAYLELKLNLSKAHEDLLEVVFMDPGFANAYLTLGKLYEMEDKNILAIQSYQHYLDKVSAGKDADEIKEKIKILMQEDKK